MNRQIVINFYWNPAWDRRLGYWGLVACILAISPLEIGSESLTLQTYYPSPLGIYTNMTTTGPTLLARDGGTVGIGSSVPNSASTLLHLRQDSRGALGPVLTIMNGGGGPGSATAIDFATYADQTANANAEIKTVDNGDWSANLIFQTKKPSSTDGSNPLVERMRIASNGNVGIGTVSPQKNLSVNGGLNIDQANLNDGTGLTNGLTFGSNSGEGITSQRSGNIPFWALDFYAESTKQAQIDRHGLHIDPMDLDGWRGVYFGSASNGDPNTTAIISQRTAQGDLKNNQYGLDFFVKNNREMMISGGKVTVSNLTVENGLTLGGVTKSSWPNQSLKVTDYKAQAWGNYFDLTSGNFVTDRGLWNGHYFVGKAWATCPSGSVIVGCYGNTMPWRQDYRNGGPHVATPDGSPCDQAQDPSNFADSYGDANQPCSGNTSKGMMSATMKTGGTDTQGNNFWSASGAGGGPTQDPSGWASNLGTFIDYYNSSNGSCNMYANDPNESGFTVHAVCLSVE